MGSAKPVHFRRDPATQRLSTCLQRWPACSGVCCHDNLRISIRVPHLQARRGRQHAEAQPAARGGLGQAPAQPRAQGPQSVKSQSTPHVQPSHLGHGATARAAWPSPLRRPARAIAARRQGVGALVHLQ